MGAYGRFMFDEELITWSIDGGGDFFHRPRHKFSITNVSGYMRLCSADLSYRFIASQLQALHSKHTFDYQLKAHPSVIRKLYRLAIPAVAEQEKVAECLSTLDELIDAESQKLDALRTHKQGLMQQLFPREGETLPRLRFPEFCSAPEWSRKPLAAVATFYNGRAYKQEELLERGRYRVLRVGNFFTSNVWYYSDLELEEAKYCDRGDLLYAWSASFGPRIWNGERTIYHYHIWKVVQRPEVDKAFLYVTLESETARMKAQSANGLGILHITKGMIERWEVAFPELTEQLRVSACLSSADTLIAAQAERLDALRTHKQGLMQWLFPTTEPKVA